LTIRRLVEIGTKGEGLDNGSLWLDRCLFGQSSDFIYVRDSGDRHFGGDTDGKSYGRPGGLEDRGVSCISRLLILVPLSCGLETVRIGLKV
jgi:hypothetical protein